MLDSNKLINKINFENSIIEGTEKSQRMLSDLSECYVNQRAYKELLSKGDQIAYSVSSVEPANGPGDMHYGLGMLMPGKVGNEYFLTKGHFHTRREAAEIYIGLRGQGAMLLEDEQTGESKMVEITANSVIYVPGYTAHRTYNTGKIPLVYLGIYPADAGHDYESIKKENFKNVVIETSSGPKMKKRLDL